MIRGSQTLTAIFTDNTPKLRKVNGAFLAGRDTAICYRFYYYYQILRRRFDDIPEDLEKEFYISSSTIVKRLTECNSMLKEINQKAPTRNDLKQLYPHLNWSDKQEPRN